MFFIKKASDLPRLIPLISRALTSRARDETDCAHETGRKTDPRFAALYR